MFTKAVLRKAHIRLHNDMLKYASSTYRNHNWYNSIRIRIRQFMKMELISPTKLIVGYMLYEDLRNAHYNLPLKNIHLDPVVSRLTARN